MSFQKKVFSNGLTLVTADLDSTEAVTVVVYVKVGSRYEQATTQGIAHFLEHVVFKGTKKRPSSSHITKELDGVGADYNAFTTKDHTGYYVKAEYTHLELALDLLSDMVLKPLLPTDELLKEKGVVLEEINMYEDQPSSLIEELFDEHVYGAKHPLGKFILGTPKTITDLTVTQVRDFHKRYYQPHNITVGISGKLPGDVHKLVQKYFSQKKPNTKLSTKPFVSHKPSSRVLLQHKETKQAHLALGFRTPLHYSHKDVNRLKIANIVFGGSMSSRLFSRVREKHGLGYYVYSSLSLYEDASNWHIGVGVDTERLNQAIKLLVKEWEVLAKGITAKELHAAKEYYKGKLTLRTEDSAHVAQWYARQGLFGLKHKTPAELKAELDTFTKDEVNALLKKYIKPKSLQLAMIGPFKDAKEFSALLPK